MFKKITITVPNSLYGDKETLAYAKDGVAVARIGKEWGVFHALAGTEIFYKLRRKTLAEAKAVAAQVASLEVEWERPMDQKIFSEQFRESTDAIRQIAGD